MTLCRKCGKEIPDGQEICEDCQEVEEEIDEAYLDDLMHSMEEKLESMQSMGKKQDKRTEPVTEQSEAEILQEEPEALQEIEEVLQEEPDALQEIEEVLQKEPEALQEPEEELQEEPEALQENENGEEDINQLLDLLSHDYEEYEETPEKEEPEEELTEERPDESPVEASLFTEDDAEESIFADDQDSLSVEDVFGDALSAVDYSEAEEEVQEEFLSPEEAESSGDFTDLALDTLALSEEPEVLPEEAEGSSEIPKMHKEPESAEPQDKKESFWKRVFGNIITEQSAEEEAKEREQEQADAAERAAAKEEKKKQMAAEKEEKAEQVKAEKEKKKAEKAEKAAVKAAEKAEKKRLKAEMEAREVVGRINPLGASIVMVFFGLVCVLIVVGSQALSYTSSVNRAESSFEKRDYKAAYQSLAGVDVSDASQEMKEKVRICMQLQRQLDAYKNYYEMKMYLESLDSLMKGIRSYDANKSKADGFEILGQYNELEGKLANQLYQEFGVSESQARNINSVETQEEYTSRLENIIAQWERRNKEDEK